MNAFEYHATYCPCGGACYDDVEKVMHMQDLKLRPEEEIQTNTWEFRWANTDKHHNMPTPRELEDQGYVKVRQHPFWPESWLMKRARGGH